jgi:hypothetical protein
MAWDYTDAEYAKQAAADPVWDLERRINGGLPNGERINGAFLERYLPQIKISPDRRAFLELLVWNKPF